VAVDARNQVDDERLRFERQFLEKLGR